MTIEVEYRVDLPDEVIQPKLMALGLLISQEMRKLAFDMGLKQTGDYAQGFLVSIKNGLLIIENRTKYAEALEFGTYEFGMAFSEETFPPAPFPKKKDISPKAREGFPRGGQPFGVVRRVLYNKGLMERLINQVFG